MMLSVPIKLLPRNEDLLLPAYQTAGAAAMDVRAAVTEPVTIRPRAWVLVPCGFALALPSGFEAQVRPRSGLAVDFGITILNTPCTIDPDYRGEIMVCLINLGKEDFIVRRGMRIAQLVVAPTVQVAWTKQDSLPETERDDDGFGSTGSE